ncbi:putative mitochondrial glycoprotein [Helianthus annuus]|nr:putative mitochondrial glycoprotein [Helianthus annuus]
MTMFLRRIGQMGRRQSSSILSCYRPLITPIQHPSPNEQSRGFVSEMRKTAFEDRIRRLIRNDIQYELDRSPLTQLVSKFKSFSVDERSGEQWIRLNKKFGDNEEIKLEDEDSGILEFICNVWPDSIEIDKVFMRDQDGMTGKPYLGPPFHDLDDELQSSLYDFLESRGINDELVVFLHKCMQHKSKNEYIRWMGNIESFVARKK